MDKKRKYRAGKRIRQIIGGMLVAVMFAGSVFSSAAASEMPEAQTESVEAEGAADAQGTGENEAQDEDAAGQEQEASGQTGEAPSADTGNQAGDGDDDGAGDNNAAAEEDASGTGENTAAADASPDAGSTEGDDRSAGGEGEQTSGTKDDVKTTGNDAAKNAGSGDAAAPANGGETDPEDAAGAAGTDAQTTGTGTGDTESQNKITDETESAGEKNATGDINGDTVQGQHAAAAGSTGAAEDAENDAEDDAAEAFTLIFACQNKEYVMPGGGKVPLADILKTFDIEGEITFIHVSDETLFTVAREGGEWTVSSLAQFADAQELKIEADGTKHTIAVTCGDAARKVTIPKSAVNEETEEADQDEKKDTEGKDGEDAGDLTANDKKTAEDEKKDAAEDEKTAGDETKDAAEDRKTAGVETKEAADVKKTAEAGEKGAVKEKRAEEEEEPFALLFSYKGGQALLQQGETAAVSDIAKAVGIDGEITGVSAPAGDALAVKETGGDWKLTAAHALETPDWMTVMADGVHPVAVETVAPETTVTVGEEMVTEEALGDGTDRPYKVVFYREGRRYVVNGGTTVDARDIFAGLNIPYDTATGIEIMNSTLFEKDTSDPSNPFLLKIKSYSNYPPPTSTIGRNGIRLTNNNAAISGTIAFIYQCTYADSKDNDGFNYSYHTKETALGNENKELGYVEGVYQGNDNTSFFNDLPIATIFIDEEAINSPAKRGDAIVKVLYDESALAEGDLRAGLEENVNLNDSGFTGGGGETNFLVYNQTKAMLKNAGLNPLVDNYMSGDLVSFTFKDAAKLADGSSADVVFTYSDLHIVFQSSLDQSNTTVMDAFNKGKFSLFSGNMIFINSTTGSDSTTNNLRFGMRVDVNVKVVQDGAVVPGQFYFKMADVDVDRSGETSKFRTLITGDTNNNNYFSEHVLLRDGYEKVNGYDIFIPGGAYDKNNVFTKDNKTQYNRGYKCIINKSDEGYMFNPTVSDEKDSVYSGFMILANNAKEGTSHTTDGVKLTTWAAGCQGAVIKTYLLAGNSGSEGDDAKAVWHEVLSSSSAGGGILTSTNTNDNGQMNDGGTPLNQTLVQVAPGKNLGYSMKPDPGWELKLIKVNEGSTDWNSGKVIYDINGDNNSLPDNVSVVTVGSGSQSYKEGDKVYFYRFKDIHKDYGIRVEWQKPYTDYYEYRMEGGDGSDVPDIVNGSRPADKQTRYLTGETATPKAFQGTDIKTEGGIVYIAASDGTRYIFVGWDNDSVEIKDADVKFIGTWKKSSPVKEEYSYESADTLPDKVKATLPSRDTLYYKNDTVTPLGPVTTPAGQTSVPVGNDIYTFEGWKENGSSVTGSVTIADRHVNAGKIVFVGSWTKTEIKYTERYEYENAGTLPAAVNATLPKRAGRYSNGTQVTPANPGAGAVLENGKYTVRTEEGGKEYLYTFSGWNPNPATVNNADVIFRGNWTKTEIKYTEHYEYENAGTLPTAVNATLPTRAEQYSNGTQVTPANPGAGAVLENGKYTVRTEESGKEYLYTFSGWNPNPATVNNADVTFKGSWTKTEIVPVTYTEHYEYEDAANLPAAVRDTLPTRAERYADGTSVIPENPGGAAVPENGKYTVRTQEGGKEYLYTFSGWNPNPATVNGADVTFRGSWTKTEIKYTEHYEYEDAADLPAAVLDTLPTRAEQYSNGTQVTPANPGAGAVLENGKYTVRTEESGKEYLYTFSGWNPNPATVNNADVTFKGSWTKTEIVPVTYTEHYEYEDAANLPAAVRDTLPTRAERYADGTSVIPENPGGAAVPENGKYTVRTEEGGKAYLYTFSGWNPNPATVNGADVTFRGSWAKTEIPVPVPVTYTEHYVYEDAENLPSEVLATLPKRAGRYADGATVTAANPSRTVLEAEKPKGYHYKYTFAGWQTSPLTVNGADVTFVGRWSKKLVPPYPDSYVFVSLSGETFPLEVQEALNAERPEIRSHVNGSVVTPLDPKRLSVVVDNTLYTFVGYDEDELTIEDDAVLFTGRWTTQTVYFEHYSYEDASSLPGEVMDTLPTRAGYYFDGDRVTPAFPSQTSVTVGNLTYTFEGWDQLWADVEQADVYFVGKWKAVAGERREDNPEDPTKKPEDEPKDPAGGTEEPEDTPGKPEDETKETTESSHEDKPHTERTETTPVRPLDATPVQENLTVPPAQPAQTAAASQPRAAQTSDRTDPMHLVRLLFAASAGALLLASEKRRRRH